MPRLTGSLVFTQVCPRVVSERDRQMNGEPMGTRPDPNVYPYNWFQQQSTFRLRYDVLSAEFHKRTVEDADTDTDD